MRIFQNISAAFAIIFSTFFGFYASAKTALLVTHYGSSDNDTRAVTIDKITADMKDSFPEIEVREAYISPIVRDNLAKKGIIKDSPVEALLKLRVEGYDSVYVQSTTIIDGGEMAEVRKSVAETSQFFNFIKVGNSLLHTPDDCMELVEILAEHQSEPDEIIIYVGHGNFLPSTATYTQLDYIFKNKGYERFYVSTIEGYPDAKATLHEIGMKSKIKKVKLIPLLLVCGNHTRNDIANDFADEFKSAGFDVEVVMRGLAETEAVRKMYVAKAMRLMSE